MITAFDKRLLNIVQIDLPLVKRPFAILAEKLDAEEAIVIERLRFLKEQGFIRRMGPFFDSAKLGYVGTLVALEVTEKQVSQVAKKINSYYGVTHNYEREGELNLWFTLLSPNLAAQDEILDIIRKLDGVVRFINLPSAQKFKVNVQFSLS
ncbi:Lrp/AsnC family transcriptional regulator [Pelosinus sp. UFO1]|uniref:siroheme decarboxylase subunit alpha n=1 Tax=Pelosinus sp. UFO1 TaxID=484770 RepID=UPI0004D116E9|nr:Lrp/AsnC family transcriptional regulator [Pelosinus sp. UFO1]AIF52954.1 putative transcriptional regulator, AsnC family [Pelosinus sp. UFO1]